MKIYSTNGVSTSLTRRCGIGGTVLAHCLRPRSESVAFVMDPIRTGVGTLMKCLSAINGETRYLWRAIDHEGEVLEVLATKRRDRRAALRLLKRVMKRYGRPASIVTDRLQSYRAVMQVIDNEGCQETRRWLNNRAENSHQPFRRQEGAMARFRDIKTLQKFASVHASIHNHFNHQRHLNRRDIFKQARAAALAEWRQLVA